MAIKHFTYSFAPGYEKIKKAEEKNVKKEIGEILGTQSPYQLSRKKNSYRDIPVHIYKDITKMFVRYGVPEDEIWNIEQAKN